MAERIDWEGIKALALGLDLPEVVEATSWGEPCLKAHGKLWVWWSPHEDVPAFKVDRDMRDVLLEAEPDRFFTTNHYKAHALILVRVDQFDPVWAEANLRATWRAMAPKRFLKAWDTQNGG
jgi:hypothetical protein